jgi:hypothetical protein
VTGGGVQINTTNRPLVVTAAHGSSNYLFEEPTTVVAWTGPFDTSKTYWLYLDYNVTTLVRTFGATTTPPIVSSRAPHVHPVVAATTANISLTGLQTIDGVAVATGDLVLVKNQTNQVENGLYLASTIAWARFSSFDTSDEIASTFFQVMGGGQAGTYWALDGVAPVVGVDPLVFSRRSEQDRSQVHWFDTGLNRMFVREARGWREVIRVFAAKLIGGSTFASVSADAPAFTGTQIGVSNARLDSSNHVYYDPHIWFDAGHVLMSEDGYPIARNDKTFVTSADHVTLNGSKSITVNPESGVVRVQCDQAALPIFSVAVISGNGLVRTATYEDVGTAAVGVIMDDLVYGESGSMTIQGLIANPDWSFTNINTPLWVDNGALVSVDPHVSSPTLHPNAKPPVARVISETQVVFMQGLGLKGDKGDPGTSAGSVPQATTSVLGTVKLNLADPTSTVVVDSDPRMTNARVPLPHSQAATTVSFAPAAGITDTDVQGAITTLGNGLAGKVNKSGDIMTGALTLSGDPSAALHAATKQYVDNLVTGIVVRPPVQFANLISDAFNAPPLSPVDGDVFLIGSAASGLWAGHSNELVIYKNSGWTFLGAISSFAIGTRFGISIETTASTPSGTFVGKTNQIAILSGVGPVTWTFEIPHKNDAFYVKDIRDDNAFHQYVFDGTNWNEFGQPMPVSFTPAGSNTQVQFNDAGSFGADATLAFDKTAGKLTVGGGFVQINGTAFRIDNAATAVPFISGTMAGVGRELTLNGELRLTAGSNYLGFTVPNSIATNVLWTLPAADGGAGQVLQTDGAGHLSWTSLPPSSLPVEGLSNYLPSAGGPADGNILVRLSSGTQWTNRQISVVAENFINFGDLKDVDMTNLVPGAIPIYVPQVGGDGVPRWVVPSVATLETSVDMFNVNTKRLVVQDYSETLINPPPAPVATTLTFDFSLGNSAYIELADGAAIDTILFVRNTVEGFLTGRVYSLTVILKQPPTTPATINWSAVGTNGTLIHWSNGVGPALSTTAGEIDVFTFVYVPHGLNPPTILGFQSGQNMSVVT